MSDTDPSTATWYAKPNDLIGGWCVMDVDRTPAEAQRPEIADFTTREHAEHIADLHNASLAREHWHHAPDGSPYTRLQAYGEGDDVLPHREDVMELLRSFNAATAMNGVHRRALTRAWERLDMAQRAPGPSGLTRVWSGYDDDECWFPMFANLADAKAYAEAAYRAHCIALGNEDPGEITWKEREARTEDRGYPGMFDLDSEAFGADGWVVCETLVHASLASGLAEHPIPAGDEPAPEPQIEGQTEIALVPGRQDTPAEVPLTVLSMTRQAPREFDPCLIRFERRGQEIWANFFDRDGEPTGTTSHPGDMAVAGLIVYYEHRGWSVAEPVEAESGAAR